MRSPSPAAAARLGALAALLVLAFLGCATADEGGPRGVRAGFEAVKLERIAVLPFTAADPFSQTRAEQQDMLLIYEERAALELERLGVSTLPPSRVRALLAQAGREGELRRLGLRRPLELLFEPEAHEVGVSLEDDRQVFARELGALLGVDALLIGQVVYHTTGRCAPSAESPWTPHVAVEGAAAPAGDAPVPCAISHVQAKLLDARTGLTVWYNRALREVRAAAPDAPTPDPLANCKRAVQLILLDAEAGLTRLLKPL